jgi:tRNA threonylcarbamoyl adenosine modification protein (Sua5/YciO/YrdC/YwlC family)
MSKLNELKQPPAGRPWPLLVSAEQDLSKLGCVITDIGARLIEVFWPGQVTLVLPCSGPLSDVAGRTEDGAVGFRVPAGPMDLIKILHDWGAPITGTSANVTGSPPATTQADVEGYFGDAVECIVPGRCPGGVASTVVDVTGSVPDIIREGAVPTASILDVLS